MADETLTATPEDVVTEPAPETTAAAETTTAAPEPATEATADETTAAPESYESDDTQNVSQDRDGDPGYTDPAETMEGISGDDTATTEGTMAHGDRRNRDNTDDKNKNVEPDPVNDVVTETTEPPTETTTPETDETTTPETTNGTTPSIESSGTTVNDTPAPTTAPTPVSQEQWQAQWQAQMQQMQAELQAMAEANADAEAMAQIGDLMASLELMNDQDFLNEIYQNPNIDQQAMLEQVGNFNFNPNAEFAPQMESWQNIVNDINNSVTGNTITAQGGNASIGDIDFNVNTPIEVTVGGAQINVDFGELANFLAANQANNQEILDKYIENDEKWQQILEALAEKDAASITVSNNNNNNVYSIQEVESIIDAKLQGGQTFAPSYNPNPGPKPGPTDNTGSKPDTSAPVSASPDPTTTAAPNPNTSAPVSSNPDPTTTAASVPSEGDKGDKSEKMLTEEVTYGGTHEFFQSIMNIMQYDLRINIESVIDKMGLRKTFESEGYIIPSFEGDAEAKYRSSEMAAYSASVWSMSVGGGSTESSLGAKIYSSEEYEMVASQNMEMMYKFKMASYTEADLKAWGYTSAEEFTAWAETFEKTNTNSWVYTDNELAEFTKEELETFEAIENRVLDSKAAEISESNVNSLEDANKKLEDISSQLKDLRDQQNKFKADFESKYTVDFDSYKNNFEETLKMAGITDTEDFLNAYINGDETKQTKYWEMLNEHGIDGISFTFYCDEMKEYYDSEAKINAKSEERTAARNERAEYLSTVGTGAGMSRETVTNTVSSARESDSKFAYGKTYGELKTSYSEQIKNSLKLNFGNSSIGHNTYETEMAANGWVKHYENLSIDYSEIAKQYDKTLETTGRTYGYTAKETYQAATEDSLAKMVLDGINKRLAEHGFNTISLSGDLTDAQEKRIVEEVKKGHEFDYLTNPEAQDESIQF